MEGIIIKMLPNMV